MKRYSITSIKNKQKGVTLIELLLGIGIVIVVIGVGILIYQQVFGGANTYQASSGVMNIHAAVKDLYKRPDFQGLQPSVLLDAGKVPQNMVSGTNIVGQWGGNMALAAGNYNGTNNAFTIAVPNVPRAECNSIISGIEANFVRIEVGTLSGTTFTAGTNGTVKDLGAATPVRPTATSVAAACNNEQNAIRFTSI